MIRAKFAAAMALGAAAVLCGCNASQDGNDSTGTITKSVSRVAPGQTGLEVVHWQIADDGRRLEDALRKHAVPAVAAMDEEALRNNGFVVCPVKCSDLDALLADMGGSYMDVRTWFGQVTSWREISSAQASGALLEIDGVARDRPGAVARLMLRSWPLPMEDGTRIAVEMVPQVVMDASESSLLRHGERLGGQVVSSCAAELELDRDVAWVVTCDPSRQIELKLPTKPAPPSTDVPPPESVGAPATAPANAPAPAPAPPAVEPSPTPAPAAPATPPTPPAPTSGTTRVPPPPPVQAAPAQTARPHTRPPLDAPPLEQPAAPTRKKPATAPAPAPASAPAPARTAAAWLPALALAAQSDPTAPSSGAKGARVVTLGVQLLLATPEGAGVPARRTVLVLIPHLDSSPFPAAPQPEPMTTASTP